MANFADVPMGASQRSTGRPATGTGSYARSVAPVPDPLGALTTHTSADPDRVPSDVMTGALEENPNASDDVATSESVGEPLPDVPYLETGRTPLVPPGVAPPDAVGMYT